MDNCRAFQCHITIKFLHKHGTFESQQNKLSATSISNSRIGNKKSRLQTVSPTHNTEISCRTAFDTVSANFRGKRERPQSLALGGSGSPCVILMRLYNDRLPNLFRVSRSSCWASHVHYSLPPPPPEERPF